MLGDRIKQARARKALSLRALADAAGAISAQAISNYETGKDAPSSGVLLRLAKVLDVPIDYLFRSTAVTLGAPAYRKHCQLSKAEMAALESRTEDIVERYVEAEALIGDDAVVPFAIPAEVSTTVRSIEDVEDKANALRMAWKAGTAAIDNLTELLEDHGVKVIFQSAGDYFDGCAYPDGDVPVIVVNDTRPTDRIRFDLVHELGHLVLRFPDDWDDKEIEGAAHRFASAFLVPADIARKELGHSRNSISLLELQRLKLKYGMSMQAWLRRAKDLGIVSPTSYNALYRKIIVRNRWMKQEAFELPLREQSTRMERIVARAYIDSLVSEARAAELLQVSCEDFVNCVAHGDLRQ